MREIGGYFELELPKKIEYHDKAIKLNTGRNALEYIIKANNYRKIYIPFYMCNSILEPINKIGIEFEYYSIDKEFNIKLDLSIIENDALLLYVNYFGICNVQVDNLIKNKKKYGFGLCIDNTQAFFNKPKEEDHTLYSIRKFFGVPDGAYLYTNKLLENKINRELGYDKSIHLIKRIDVGATEGYDDFKECSRLYSSQDIRYMSNLSQRILQSIDYQEVLNKRKCNFYYLHNELEKLNEISIDIENIVCPMVYPLYIRGTSNLRQILISNGIFVAQYWPGILNKVDSESIENNLINYLIPLPIDQRYSQDDMEYILKIIKRELNK